jgi:hypothetical protein
MLGEILTTYCAVATLLLALTEVLYGQPVISSLLGTITDSSVRGDGVSRLGNTAQEWTTTPAQGSSPC